LLPVSVGVLLGLLFSLEDGSDVSLQNMGLSPNYTVLQPVVTTMRASNPTFIFLNSSVFPSQV
jgi:hypothetical protein